MAHRFNLIVVGTLLWICVCVTGCAGDPDPPDHALPPLSAVRSRLEPPPGSESANTRTVILAGLTRVDLPLGDSLELAWDIVDDSTIDGSMAALWEANGLRMGLIRRDQINQFIRALPDPVHTQYEKVLVSDQPIPILTSPKLREPIPIESDLTARSIPQEISGGRCQLLARVTKTRTGSLDIELTPLHHLPKTSLRPRSHSQKRLDGRIFTELSLRVNLSNDSVLILAIIPPPPPPEDPEPLSDPEQVPGPTPDTTPDTIDAMVDLESPRPDTSKEVPPHADIDEVTETTPSAPAIPTPGIGRSLLTAQRLNHPIQTVLMITVGVINPPKTEDKP